MAMRRVPTAIDVKGEDIDVTDRKTARRSTRVNDVMETFVVVE